MNYTAILQGLTEAKAKPAQANVYIAYLKSLDKPTTKWFGALSEKKAIDLFVKVQRRGLFIDGETVTLQGRWDKMSGQYVVSEDYDYHAYLNLLLLKYPETKFDTGLVREGDTFSFEKSNLQVSYSHKLGDVFNPNRKILGAYAVVRNSRGEFLEVINQADIDKFRQISASRNIWEMWTDRMILKSVIKRICKTAFNDCTGEIDRDDNEGYDLDAVGIALDIQQELADCATVDEVGEFYKKHKSTTGNVAGLIELCKNRKIEITNGGDH